MVEVKLKWVKLVRKTGGRKGDRILYYWRRPGYRLRRLPDDHNTPAFISQVIAWNAEADAEGRTSGPPSGSFSHLVATYLRSPDYDGLAAETQAGYKYWLSSLDREYGDLMVNSLTRRNVYDLRDKYASTPYKANAVIRILRLLLNFGVERGMIKVNPAARPKQLRVKPRRQVWSQDAEIAFLEAADPTMALAYMLGAYTAQRQGDLLTMAWSQYDGVIIRLRQRKTGELVEVTCHVALRAALDEAPRCGVLMLTTPTGRPWTTRGFNRTWHAATITAKLDGLQFRDLRRTAMVRMAEAGATAIEISGVSGHSIDQTQRILEVYIPRSAAMGKAAIIKLETARKVKE